MSTPAWGNPFLLARATSLQSDLNAGPLHLHLFTNLVLPTPASVIADFLEATFTGYAPINMAGKFNAPAFVRDGEYEVATGTLTFTCSGGPSQAIQGWWMDDGTNVVAAMQFTPAEVVSAGNPLTFSLRPQEISQSIL